MEANPPIRGAGAFGSAANLQVARNKIVAAWGKGVNQQALFEGYYAVQEIWRDNKAGARAQPGGGAIDGDIKAAFRHIAHLGVRMGTESADSAFVKTEGNEHEFRPLRENGAPVAGGNLGPNRIFGDAEGFSSFRCHGSYIAANVRQTNPAAERIMTVDHPVTDTAIIGSGFIGRAWAISFARAGACVRLWDQTESQTAGALDILA